MATARQAELFQVVRAINNAIHRSSEELPQVLRAITIAPNRSPKASVSGSESCQTLIQRADLGGET